MPLHWQKSEKEGRHRQRSDEYHRKKNLKEKARYHDLGPEEKRARNRCLHQRATEARQVGRIRYFDASQQKYGPWKVILASNKRQRSSLMTYAGNQTTIWLKRGGVLNVFYKYIPKKHIGNLKHACGQFDGYRLYPIQGDTEPRAHALLSSKKDRGYQYGSTKMKGEYIYQEKYSVFSKLLDDSRTVLHIEDFKIGMDLICYRAGNDYIGWHRDDNQEEDSILSIALGPLRPVKIATGKGKGESPEDGDEDIEIWIGDGDAYMMDRSMQEAYCHTVPKRDKIRERRYALVLRDGIEKFVQEDNGKLLDSLNPRQKVENIYGHVAGQEEGMVYAREEMIATKGHRLKEGGVCGTAEAGACAVVVSRSGANQRDGLSWLTYSSTRGEGACRFFTSKRRGLPIRVYRSSKLASPYAPTNWKGSTKYRYDGLYFVDRSINKDGEIVDVEPEKGDPEKYTFLLIRAEPSSSAGSIRPCSKIATDDLRTMILAQTKRDELPSLAIPSLENVFSA